jgi:hypothetical protein
MPPFLVLLGGAMQHQSKILCNMAKNPRLISLKGCKNTSNQNKLQNPKRILLRFDGL